MLASGLGSAQVRPEPGDIPVANLPILPVGSNDLIAVSVYDSPEFTRTVRVGADGFIRLPMMKRRIRVTGSVPAEVEKEIANALREEGLIVDPFVAVTVAEYTSRPVAVMGAVKRPLTFQAVGPVTLLDALARAEGLAPEAGADILVTLPTSMAGKDGALTRRIPVKGLIDAADPALNIRLTGGEEIRVPELGRIYVLGNVKKPGAYIAGGTPETSVLKALAMAEGLLPYSAKQAFIYRREANGARNDLPVDLAKMMARKAPDLPLLANDILYIPDAKGTRAGMAALEKLLLFGGGAMTALIYAGVR